MLKAKANYLRIRVIDTDTRSIIGYFDVQAEDGRTILASIVRNSLLKIAARVGRNIEATLVYIVFAKNRQHYLEVRDPKLADTCLVVRVPETVHTIVRDGKTYVLSQDDYFYRVVDDEAFREPILALKKYWDAEDIFASK